MKKLFVFVLMAMLLVSIVAATGNNNDNDNNNHKSDCGKKWFCNQGLTFECQNFYNNSNYYTIAKWTYNEDEEKYVLDEQNNKYRYYRTNVEGDLESADWTSNPNVQSVLVKAGNNRTEFAGGAEGSVNTSGKDISHITLCGYKTGNGGGCTGGDCGGNGVPEFPAFALGAAVLVVTLGLVFIRKN